jgi:predicted secreted protein
LELNGAPVDISSDDSAGWRELLANISGQDEVNITVSGVTKDQVLKNDWFGNTRTRVATITDADGSVLSGTFYLAAYTEKASYKDARTFQATLNSSGPVTFTPGS